LAGNGGSAYGQFISVVEEGRPKLKGKLEELVVDHPIPAQPRIQEAQGEVKEKIPMVRFTRQRADGGIYTSAQALELGLIDQIGYLDDAIAEAKKDANLARNAR